MVPHSVLLGAIYLFLFKAAVTCHVKCRVHTEKYLNDFPLDMYPVLTYDRFASMLQGQFSGINSLRPSDAYMRQ